jgi:hypothetical protein
VAATEQEGSKPKGKRPKGNRIWQRPLQNDKVELHANLNGHSLHVIAPPSIAGELLNVFRDQCGVAELPLAAIKGKRRLSRGPKPVEGQEAFHDTGAPA